MRVKVARYQRHAVNWLMPVIASCMIWGCGGGGGGDNSTPLPQSLQITLPQTQQAVSADIAFSSSLGGSSSGLSYRWDFGDGASSTSPSPSHRYSKPGRYQVRLVITNEAGKTVSATASVSVADLAVVQGRLCSGRDLMGWCWQRPLPQGNALHDYAWVDDTHAWAVGDAGAVMATRDGGQTWTAQDSGTASGLTRVTFIDRQTGWAAGDAGQLLKTADGGATWQGVSLGIGSWSVDELGVGGINTAWVRAGGEAYITTDGGNRWRKVVAPDSPNKLVPVSSSDLWAKPGRSNCSTSPSLQHSVDGGVSWTQVPLPPIAAPYQRCVDDLQVIDANNAMVVATDVDHGTPGAKQQSVWHTTDRGLSWHALKRPADIPIDETIDYRLSRQSTVFATGSRVGPLRRTTDGGATWRVVSGPAGFHNNFSDTYGAPSYRAYSADRIWIRDETGSYFTSDGGASWGVRVASDGFAFPMMALWFFDSRHGLALNSDGSIHRTTDGGQTWSSSKPDGTPFWRGVQFLPDGTTGWAFEATGQVWRSTDRGANWTQASHMSRLADLHFLDAQRGWAVSSEAIYRTVDGGRNWQAAVETVSAGFKSIRFADAQHGVAVGPAGAVFVTSDAGASWRARPTGSAEQLHRVAFIDAQHVVAVGNGGSIVLSNDGGETWRSAPTVTRLALNDVRFASANVGYAVGNEGIVLVTRDGGASWVRSPTNTWSNLWSVFFVDEFTGWVSGNNGAVLATVNGGR